MNEKLKHKIKKLSKLGLDINKSFDRGLSAFGLNISLPKHSYTSQSKVALNKCLLFKPSAVLDVGSGGGQHAKAFAEKGAKVTCIDFGTSIYAQNTNVKNSERIEVINIDFQQWNPIEKYDLVWASHILEHQRNVGSFIEKLIDCCKPDGHIAITVPFPHRNLWGGHLSVWTPGLLAYNCVMCGIDISESPIFYGYREISIIFKPIKIILPELTFDNGDILRLKKHFPKGFTENSDGWF